VKEVSSRMRDGKKYRHLLLDERRGGKSENRPRKGPGGDPKTQYHMVFLGVRQNLYWGQGGLGTDWIGAKWREKGRTLTEGEKENKGS